MRGVIVAGATLSLLLAGTVAASADTSTSDEQSSGASVIAPMDTAEAQADEPEAGDDPAEDPTGGDETDVGPSVCCIQLKILGGAIRLATIDMNSFQYVRTSTRKGFPDTTYNWSTDGCSAPFISKIVLSKPLYMSVMVPACQRHDFGYRNFGKGRLQPTQARKNQIDNQFLLDMQKICSDTYPGIVRASARSDCLTLAYEMAGGVSSFGNSSFFP